MSSPDKWTHETWTEFLTDNFFFLSKLTKVESFLPWLRQKRVLTESDEEDIMSRNTSSLRSARLIDTIKYKGTRGAIAYLEVVEWVYPEVYTSICGRPARPPPLEFNQTYEDPSPFRKSRILLDQLQRCMGSILDENKWKREDIVQLRETVQNLKLENETMMDEMKLLREKFERSVEEAEELRSFNHELQKSLVELRGDSDRKSLDDVIGKVMRRNVPENTNTTSPPVAESRSYAELNNHCKQLEENLTKFEQILTEKETDNDRQRKEIDQLIDLNYRVKMDYMKAMTTSQHQQETLNFYKSEKEKLGEQELSNFEENGHQQSPDIIPKIEPVKLVRKKVIRKQKNSNGSNISSRSLD